MKIEFKPLYIYTALVLLIAVTFLIVFTIDSGEKETKTFSENLPDDEIHRGFQSDPHAPTQMNVSKEVQQKLDQLKTEYEKNTSDTAKAKEYADYLTAAHKSDDAISIYENILKINPKRNDILFALTFIYYNKIDLDKSSFYNNQILKYDSQNLDALYNSGAILAASGKEKEAKEIWNKIIKDNPLSPAAQMAKSAIQEIDS